jgi:GT2 family glycosyltransferase
MNSLIVLNYNDADTTIRFLKMAKSLPHIGKIVVVDNKSTDGSFEILRANKDDNVDVIQTKYNGGYARGNNFGAYYAIEKYSPDILVIANPDVGFSDDVIYKFEEILTKTDNVAAVTCKMKCLSGIDLPDAWKLPRYSDCILEQLLLLRRLIGNRTKYSEDYFAKNPLAKVDVVPGSLFAIKSDVFKSLGGFDESTFLYQEENLLAAKIKRHGLSSYLVTGMTYLHMHSVSINKNTSGVYRRLKLAYTSRKVYCDKVLGIGYIKELILAVTFYIGAFNYLIAKALIHKFKNNDVEDKR